MSIDQHINDAFLPIAHVASSVIFYSVPVLGQDVKLLLILLVGAALFFTVYLGFINVRLLRHAIDIATGKYDKATDDGHISSWQALMASMSGTVGLGNIAGVAVAISTGGPGAVFWMFVLAFFNMSVKFSEVYLGVRYRKSYDGDDDHHHVSGGPMYYLKQIFDEFNLPALGAVISVIFALCCIVGSIGGGMIFQSNQAFQQLVNVTGGADGALQGNGWIFGLIVAALVGFVIVGGIKSIASVSARLVPFMLAIYALASLYVIILHVENIPGAVVSIFTEAFNFKAGLGGVLGGLLVGAQRAAFSNESGLGTAAVVYSAARADKPMRQAIASMLGPMVDTMIICMITALMILISGVYDPNAQVEGVALTSRALSEGGSLMPYLLAFVIFLFAYSTMISNAYISSKALGYLTNDNPVIDKVYKVFFCLCAVLGSVSPLGSVVEFTDAVFLSMAIPNIVGLFMFAPTIKRDLKAYLKEQFS